MTISFNLPPQIERILRELGGEPNVFAKQAALVELYRLRRITHHQLGEALGISRLETDAVLKRHDVPLDLSVDDFREELDALRESNGP